MKKIRNNLRKTKILINPMFNNGNIFQKMPRFNIISRIIVEPNQNFVYIRVPKAANSTVTNLLWSCVQSEESLVDNINQKKYKNDFINAKQLSLKQASLAKKYYYFFIIVRNPYDRVLSAYLNKFSTKKYVEKFGQKISKYGDGSINFKSFCYYLKHGGLFENPHWIPQSEYVWPSYDRLDYIGKVEKLTYDLKNIFSVIFDDCNIDVEKFFGPKPTYASSKRDDYYDVETKEIISKLYANDFSLFNYKFE